jgi:hypothetical protein
MKRKRPWFIFPPDSAAARRQAWSKTFLGRKALLGWPKNTIGPSSPPFFSGVNTDFFYNLANLRRWSGLGFNIEMLFLVDQMFKQQGKEFTISFGQAIPAQALEEGSSGLWARKIRRQVYTLEKETLHASA